MTKKHFEAAAQIVRDARSKGWTFDAPAHWASAPHKLDCSRR